MSDLYFFSLVDCSISDLYFLSLIDCSISGLYFVTCSYSPTTECTGARPCFFEMKTACKWEHLLTWEKWSKVQKQRKCDLIQTGEYFRHEAPATENGSWLLQAIFFKSLPAISIDFVSIFNRPCTVFKFLLLAIENLSLCSVWNPCLTLLTRGLEAVPNSWYINSLKLISTAACFLNYWTTHI